MIELYPYGTIDITPRVGGVVDLLSSSTDGTYEIRDYICGSDGYKLIMRGNYSDLSLMISPNTCVKLVNIVDTMIHISYKWYFGGSINSLLVSTAILYVFFLCTIGICILIGCAIGGRGIRYIYENKILPHIRKDNDVCQVDIVPPPPSYDAVVN